MERKIAREMEHIFSFEELDQMLGDYAPFLLSLSDGVEGVLRIIIAAADVGDTRGMISDSEGADEITKQALNGILKKSRPIEINENCLFEICFQRDYIIYQVRNESFCSYDSDEIRHGNHLITFEKSKLLSRLGEITDARQFDDGAFYPGKWTHYGIYTQNHVIDVVSHCQPVVSRIQNKIHCAHAPYPL